MSKIYKCTCAYNGDLRYADGTCHKHYVRVERKAFEQLEAKIEQLEEELSTARIGLGYYKLKLKGIDL